eukprot:6179877-Pleurochrysis_carterae.AAC.4
MKSSRHHVWSAKVVCRLTNIFHIEEQLWSVQTALSQARQHSSVRTQHIMIGVRMRKYRAAHRRAEKPRGEARIWISCCKLLTNAGKFGIRCKQTMCVCSAAAGCALSLSLFEDCWVASVPLVSVLRVRSPVPANYPG